MYTKQHYPDYRTILIASSIILTMTMGVRHGFGFWLQPISMEHGWTREPFSLAAAWQNLIWGIAGPVAGMIADRFGTVRVVLTGLACYIGGLLCMALVSDPALYVITVGILLGLAMACTGFGAVAGIIGRSVPATQRSWAFGMSSAASSLGQFALMPLEQYLIHTHGWQIALFILTALLLLMVAPLAPILREPLPDHGASGQSVSEAIRQAFTYSPFLLLTAGYFVCGFQLIFIGTHLPSYLLDKGLADPKIAVIALACIGLFNIFGSYYAGKLGERYPKRYLLAGLYFTRSLAIIVFLLLPLSPTSVYLFAIMMGLTWLSTVPLTNAIIANMFGLRYLSMLSGFVFLSHQVGGFLGAWLGGYLFTQDGNYNTVWLWAIGLGFFAALVNLPINEGPFRRHAAKAI